MDETIVNSLGNEFKLQSKLFREFVYYILEEKFKKVCKLQIRNQNQMHLTIYNIPNEEIGLIVNDFASIFKPILSYIKSGSIEHINSKQSISTTTRDIKQFTNRYAKPFATDDYYVKPFEKDMSTKIDVSRTIFEQALKYNMLYIIEDLMKNYTHLIDNDLLQFVIKTHNIDLFNQCLPLVKNTNSSTLDVAILEKQDDMIYTLLKYGVSISTNSIKNICKMSEPKKILTWINLYGDDSIDVQKIIQNHIDIKDNELLLTKYARLIIPDQTTPLSDYGTCTYNDTSDDNMQTIKEQVKNIEPETEIMKVCRPLYNMSSSDILVSKIASGWNTPNIEDQGNKLQKECIKQMEKEEVSQPLDMHISITTHDDKLKNCRRTKI